MQPRTPTACLLSAIRPECRSHYHLGPAQVSIPLDELERFAQTGEASGNLNLLLSAMDEGTQAQFRLVLNVPIQTSPAAIARFTYIPMVEQVLQSFGNALQTDSGMNGFQALRSSVILASINHPEGWALLDRMRHLPGRSRQPGLAPFQRPL